MRDLASVISNFIIGNKDQLDYPTDNMELYFELLKNGNEWDVEWAGMVLDMFVVLSEVLVE